MSNINEFTIKPTINYKGTDLSAIVYPSKAVKPKGVILYFHGGGLVFGESDDLPLSYLKMLTMSDYSLISFDYPLAPEMNINEIISAVCAQVNWYLDEGYLELGFSQNDYYLMGRSAGAFLALSVAHRLDKKPRGVISLYGYYNLLDAQFMVPNRHYLEFKKVDSRIAKRLIKDKPITEGSLAERYPLYLYARQTGDWMTLLAEDNRNLLKQLSLTPKDLEEMPPTFLAAGKNDPDVPSRQTKMLDKYIPKTEMHLIETDEHDFDRTHVQEFGIPLYENIISWLST